MCNEVKTEKTEMTKAAKVSRAAYMREWRRKHPEKQREYTARTWERKAQRIADNTECHEHEREKTSY